MPQVKMKSFKCDQCSKSFGDNHQLNRHLVTHSGMKSFKCKQCPTVCSRQDILMNHVKTRHTKETAHKCGYCGKCCSSNYKLQQHIHIHTGAKPYKCFICGQRFRYPQQLKDHKNRHAGVRPLECPMGGCDKRFTCDSELKTHINYHLGVKPYACEVCGRKFTQHCHWKIHVRIHTGDRPYKCTFENCSKTFRQSAHLFIHRSSHTGVKPYECSFKCGARFRLSHTLKCHERRHTGERPYKCRMCPRAFTQPSPRNHHEKKCHEKERFSCMYSECQKVFPTMAQLKTHSLVHGGGKKFSCVFCKKGCLSRSDLFKHIRSHTREKTVYCQVCQKWYQNYHNKKSCRGTEPVEKGSKTPIDEEVPIPIPIPLSPPPSSSPTVEQPPEAASKMGETSKMNSKKRPRNHPKGKAVLSPKSKSSDDNKLVPIPIPLISPSTGQRMEDPVGDAKRTTSTPNPANDDSIIAAPTKKRFQCAICLKVMQHQNQLNGHMNIHVSQKQKGKFKRRRPPGATPTSFLVQYDMDDDKMENVEIEYATAEDEEASVAPSEKKGTSALKQQEETTADFKPELELRIESVRHVPEKELITFRPFQCERCNKMYKTTGELETHMRIHGVITAPIAPPPRKNQKSSLKKPVNIASVPDGRPREMDRAKKKKSKKCQLADNNTPAPSKTEENYDCPPEILEIFEDENVGELEEKYKEENVHEDEMIEMPKLTAPPNLSPFEMTKKEEQFFSGDALPPVLVAEAETKPQDERGSAGRLPEDGPTAGKKILHCDACNRPFTNKGLLTIHKQHHCKRQIKASVPLTEKRKQLKMNKSLDPCEETTESSAAAPSKNSSRRKTDTDLVVWKSQRKRVKKQIFEIEMTSTKKQNADQMKTTSPSADVTKKAFLCYNCHQFFGNKGALVLHQKACIHHRQTKERQIKRKVPPTDLGPLLKNDSLKHFVGTPDLITPYQDPFSENIEWATEEEPEENSVPESEEEEMVILIPHPTSTLLSDPLDITTPPAPKPELPLVTPTVVVSPPITAFPKQEPSKRYKCIICNFVTTDRALLHQHAQNSHTHYKKDIPHICPVCLRAFPTPGLLHVHRSTYPGCRPRPEAPVIRN